MATVRIPRKSRRAADGSGQVSCTHCLQVLHYLAQRRRGAVYKITAGGSPGQGLETQRTTAREQIQAAGAMHAGAQPVKQGFAHPVAGGAQARGGRKGELTPPPLAADDPQGAEMFGAVAGSGHFVALCKDVRIVVFLQALACEHSSTTISASIMKFFKRKKVSGEQSVPPETESATAAAAATGEQEPAVRAPDAAVEIETTAATEAAAPAESAAPAWTWTPQRTVYQVVVKARIWFEAYELHLARGAWIDSWLGHAPA